ncbi:hypothetical protein N9033_00830 [bacterium]|nr:hypothetical protein [bacterium]
MSNVELIREINTKGDMVYTLVDPITDAVVLRCTSAALAERCLEDLQKYGYIKNNGS